MTICYGYIRWSSDEQGDGSSEERQRASIQSFADEQGTQVEWIVDPGVSARHGYNLIHGSLAKLGNDILAGRRPLGILMVDEPSRCTREDIIGTLSFLAPLLARGLEFAVASRRLLLRRGDDATLMQLFQFGIESQGGHTENEKRVKFVRREAALRREKLAPGVVYSARVADWLECPNAKRRGQHERVVTLHPVRSVVAREICELTAAGYGSQRLAKLLNERAKTDPKYVPWRGKAWSGDVIVNLTSNRALLGEFQPHETAPREGSVANPDSKHKRRPLVRKPVGDPIKGYFPAAIGADLWDRMQAAKARRAMVKAGRPASGARQNVNLFAGLCRCGVCGSKMHLRGRNLRGKNDWLVCGNSPKGHCTNNTHYSVTRFEREFLREPRRFYASADQFTKPDSTADAVAERLDAAKQQLIAAEDAVANVQSMLPMARTPAARGAIMVSLEDAVEKVEVARAERDNLERELAVARGDDPEEAAIQMDLLTDGVKLGEPEARVAMMEVIRTVVERVECRDGFMFVFPRGDRHPVRVEFLEGTRGRRVIENAERTTIVYPKLREGMGLPPLPSPA